MKFRTCNLKQQYKTYKKDIDKLLLEHTHKTNLHIKTIQNYILSLRFTALLKIYL